MQQMQEKKTVPGVEEAVTGAAAVEVGGGVVAHGRRLQAAMLLLNRRRERFLPLLFFRFWCMVLSIPSLSLYSLFFGSVDFGLPLLSPLSHSFILFSLSLRVPSSLFSLLVLFFFCPHLWFRCRDLFIEPVIVAFHYGAWGTGHAVAGRGRSCPGVPPSVSAARLVVGQCFRSVAQRRGASGWSVGSRREKDH